MSRQITEYIFYKWRYSLGYTLVGLLVVVLLVAATLYVPGGLSQAEMTSTAISSRLSFDSFNPRAVIDLPYALLQYGSFAIFGITTLSIKLPSFLLGLLSLIGIILLLRHWFHANVAIIAALIIITTSQFIFASQDGTPTIMYVLLPTWLLLLALKVSRQTRRRTLWKFLFVTALALSLYTPLSIYILLALASATFLHPHLRYIIRKLSKAKLIVAGLIGLTILSPLIMALVSDPEIGLILLGIPDTWPNILESGIELTRTHLGFIFSDTDEQIQPGYTLPSLLLMAMGIVRLVKTRHTARSYIITSWLVLLAPIILINPNKTILTFVPVMLLIAAGIDELLHLWYKLFPRNPYARVAGLLPITLLVAGMALTGIERYFYVYRYSPPVVTAFSDDLTLVNAELNSRKSKTMLVVAPDELSFYRAVAKDNDKINVTTASDPLPNENSLIVTREAFTTHDMGDREPSKIVTNGRSEKSDRLYIYEAVSE